MNRKLAGILGVAALLGLPAPADARPFVARHAYAPVTTVSVTTFYADLSPWGSWVEVAPYGRCWAPDGVGAGWRPYADGEWIYTDLGWTWVSDEPWSWAVYHYGRWFHDPFHGWVWVPGTEWAPAWVVWRTDWEWVGWAPLPPSVGWSAWFQVRSSDFVSLEPRAWCFTRVKDFPTGNLRSRIVPPSRNAGLLGRTHDATRFGRRDGWTVNHGPDVTAVERRAGVKLPRFTVHDAVRPTGGRRGGEVAYERRGARAAERLEWRRRAPEPAKVSRRDRGKAERQVKPARRRGQEERERKDGPRDER